jgi:beta-phosphoglucomutase-like phosphatase (HAD superfamily)
MRIAIDVDSTLHHYWDVLSEISMRRFGVDLPYDEQFTWGITRLRPEQLELCIAESHSPERILAGRPYPGAVEAVRAWSAQGHFIHVTSHRDVACERATAQWLQQIGLPYDDLHCSYDKISRCAELGIELLIDDSPANIAAAIDCGIATATIVHPWNRDVCEVEDVAAAEDWYELARLLGPLLSARPAELSSRR